MDLSFCCSRRAVVSFRNDVGLPESTIAGISAGFVLSFTICPFKSSSLVFTVCLISNASAIANMDYLSL